MLLNASYGLDTEVSENYKHFSARFGPHFRRHIGLAFFFIFRKGNHFPRKWNLPMVNHILKLQNAYSLGVILLMWFIYSNLKKGKIGVFVQREKTSTENN